MEERDVVGGSSDGDGAVEDGQAEESEGFGYEEEMGRSIEREGIRGGSERCSSKEGVLEDSFDDFDGKIYTR